MRLAYCVRAIFPQHGYGGLERSASGLMRHLLLRGVDVALYTRPLPPGQPLLLSTMRNVRLPSISQEIARRSGPAGHLAVRCIGYGRLPLPPNGIPARLTNYRAFAEAVGRKVRHTALQGSVQGIYAHGLCAWGVHMAAEWGVPMVANPHGMEEFKVADPLKRLAYAPFRSWLRQGYRAADRVIATDYAMRDEVATILGVGPERVVVLPNGVDFDAIKREVSPQVQSELAARWSIATSQEGLLGISVGRIEANKGFEYLLRALSMIEWKPSDPWRWFIVGDGSLRAHLEEVAVQLGIQDKVVFTGKVTDAELHSLYAMCNLFAHPALYEGSSLVTLEAVVHALPVIASAVGGIPDKVIEGETGFLVEPGDEAGLARKVEWMVAHPVERAEMGRRGARLASAKFSLEQVAAQTEELFSMLLDEKAACRGREVSAGSC